MEKTKRENRGQFERTWEEEDSEFLNTIILITTTKSSVNDRYTIVLSSSVI